jgi:aldose 1-epimerase
MSFTARPEAAEGGHEVWSLEGVGARAEVCPALGFNCYRWSAGGRERLYRDPAFFTDGRPTRSGVPVLFPFPNRIRGGRFAWAGRDYELPRNDGAAANAIHGFACRTPWRVTDSGADDHSAWLTGEFHCAQDSPQSLPLWPADHRIRLTVRLGCGRLRLESLVDNPDHTPLPFGLGYHPYFLLAGDPPDGLVQASAYAFWPLVDSLPSGRPLDIDPQRDLNRPRPFRELSLDDVLTGLK